MKIRITGNQMQEEMLQERWQKLADWHEILLSEDTHHLGADYKGWVKLPEEMDEDLITDLVEPGGLPGGGLCGIQYEWCVY